MSVSVEVTVVSRVTYTFPDMYEKCVAHGQACCVDCARNPGSCAEQDNRPAECSVYTSTGMHWDTCANRVRGPWEGSSQ